MDWLALLALALIAGSGWCAAAETSLLRVSRAGAKELARSPGTATSPLQAVLAEVPRYLAVLALARYAAEAAATVLTTVVALHVIGPGWRAYAAAAAAVTAAIYLATGIIPRIADRRPPARVALAAAAVLHPVVRVLGPVAGFLARARRGGGHGRSPAESQEDLRGLVDLLEQRQVIEPAEREMIHSVFELGDTIAREVMVPRTDMVVVERGKTASQALSLALRSGFSRIPVIGENLDDVVGIAYLKDIVTSSHERQEDESAEKVSAIMRPVTFVPDSKPIDKLLKEMQARRIHLAIVIDEYGGTAGLVTIEDILEEIVGEITDEYDQEQPPVEWIDRGERARVTARLPAEELAELFGVHIDAEDTETVGGLLARQLGRVPIAGAVATTAGLRLTAESLAGRRNRIGTVLVERAGRPPGGQASNGTAPEQP